MSRKLRPFDAALGWLVLLFLVSLPSLGVAMCEAARIPQGFAP